jgi:hypothetical protein
MTRTSPRRKIVLFLLVAFLAVPWTAWAAGSPQSDVPGSPGLVRQVWGLLASLWSEIGCHIDPDGCAQATATPQAPVDHAAEGCNIDPSGCAQAIATPQALVGQGDIGCNIDPSGGCAK